MAETTDQIRAEIALTRDQMADTIDEISARFQATRRRIPFYGLERRQLLIIVGGAAAATAGVAFMAFYARNRRNGDDWADLRKYLRRLFRRR